MDIGVFETNGIFAWNIPKIHGGDPSLYADLLKNTGLKSVWVKVQQGKYEFRQSRLGPWPFWGPNLKVEFVQACHQRDIKVIGWAAPEGLYPADEGVLAADLCKKYDLDGFGWDQESFADSRPQADSNAVHTMNNFRDRCEKLGLDKIPVSFIWWALYYKPGHPNTLWHPKRVGSIWASLCDVCTPMIYWEGSAVNNVYWWLDASFKEWRELTDKPIVPAGRVYTGDGGTATKETVEAFAKHARELGAVGLTWWAFDNAFNREDLMQALMTVNGDQSSEPTEPTEPTDPSQPIVLEVVAPRGLNVRTSPELSAGTLRGRLSNGDKVEICDSAPIINDGYEWVQIKLYVAKKFLR